MAVSDTSTSSSLPSRLLPAGTAITVAGVHASLWLSAPVIAAILTIAEAVLAVMVIVTALYAPERVSDRAFRMLPWTTPPAEPLASATAPQQIPAATCHRE
ncbi:hypothetical protein [Nonomuraea soli]|uniref:Uncharacterized protein n=1 Tax=Nonomuraea soli TaxID=1032476 RepID=A0A7W0CUS4_9ACTN|nr:hypothetical protein [Nonomuraea soli]MBA2897752.1 hypothetical protein [Nonomuraea soli]